MRATPQRNVKREILNRIDIRAYYQEELCCDPLGDGDNLVFCPFHDDKTPSFSVNASTGLYKCFGCGEQGDIWKFHQRKYGVDFMGALRDLARRTGVEMPEQKKPHMEKAWAVARIPDTLPPAGVEYLVERRKISRDMVEKLWADEMIGFNYKAYRAKGVKEPAIVFPLVDRKLRPYGLQRVFVSDGDKRFVKGTKGKDALFCLGDPASDGPVVVTEAVIDAISVHQATGYPAVSTLSASTLDKLKALNLQHPVLFFDNDDAGRRATAKALSILGGALVVEPQNGGHKDANAMLQAGLGDEIRAMVADAKPAKAPEPSQEELEVENSVFSDLGNAKRLHADHGEDVRFSHVTNRWYLWSGGKWCEDKSGGVKSRAVASMEATARAVRSLAREKVEERPKKAASLFALADKLESKTCIGAALDLFKALDGIPIQEENFDPDPYLLNVANGVIDLRTGELKKHDREYLQSKQSPVEYDPAARCPTWERFLDRVVPDTEVRGFLQRAVGYALTGDTGEQCFFFLNGTGANGKSKFIEAVTAILGDYAESTGFSTFTTREKNDRVANELAELKGARFVTATETNAGSTLSESVITNVTGQDMVRARFLYGAPFSYQPQFKIFLSANYRPRIVGQADGAWRRVNLIPFLVKIPPAERDTNLGEKLKQELPGILAWAVRGCLEWQKRGLDVPESVCAATADYRQEQDVLDGFFREKCVITNGCRVKTSELFREYKAFCDNSGENSLGKRKFNECMRERGFTTTRSRVDYWEGIGLWSDFPQGAKIKAQENKTAHEIAHNNQLKNSSIYSDLSSLSSFKQENNIRESVDSNTCDTRDTRTRIGENFSINCSNCSTDVNHLKQIKKKVSSFENRNCSHATMRGKTYHSGQTSESSALGDCSSCRAYLTRGGEDYCAERAIVRSSMSEDTPCEQARRVCRGPHKR